MLPVWKNIKPNISETHYGNAACSWQETIYLEQWRFILRTVNITIDFIKRLTQIKTKEGDAQKVFKRRFTVCAISVGLGVWKTDRLWLSICVRYSKGIITLDHCGNKINALRPYLLLILALINFDAHMIYIWYLLDWYYKTFTIVQVGRSNGHLFVTMESSGWNFIRNILV